MAAATPAHLGPRRLSQQRLTRAPLATPAEVVGWLGAVQSQEYQAPPGAVGTVVAAALAVHAFSLAVALGAAALAQLRLPGSNVREESPS